MNVTGSRALCSLLSKNVRRSCLKVCDDKEPKQDATNTKSKTVHFADSLGMELTSVHIIHHCTPIVSLREFIKRNKLGLKHAKRKENRFLNFIAPITLHFFNDKVERNGVSLANIIFLDSSISGTVVVNNIAFDKRVSVRYTINSWESFDDIKASYVHGTCTGKTDTFSFQIFMPCAEENSVKIEFAIKYEVAGQIFWDSNFDENYQLICYRKSKLEDEDDEVEELNNYEKQLSTYTDCLCQIHKRLPMYKSVCR